MIERPWYWIVSPLSGDGIRSREHTLVDGDSTARACADDHSEYDPSAVPGSIDGFRECEAVGVVRETHRPPERRLEIAIECATDQTRRIGVFDEACCGRDRAGDPDADRALPRELGLHRAHQLQNRLDDRIVVIARSRDSLAAQLASIGVESDNFSFRAAKVDSNSHGPILGDWEKPVNAAWTATNSRNTLVIMVLKEEKKPRYALAEYRKFIREAAPYVSIVAGRKIKPSDAETISEKDLIELALRIDSRVDDLKNSR